MLVKETVPEPQIEIAPRAHILRFLLDPGYRSSCGIGLESFANDFIAQGVELLESNERDVVTSKLTPLCKEVVINLAAAEIDAPCLCGFNSFVAQNSVEPAG